MRLHASYGNHLTIWVPLEHCASQLCVYEHRLVVGITPHDLHPPILKAYAQCWYLVVRPSESIVPIDAGNCYCTLCATLKAVDGNPMRVNALVIIHMHFAIQGAEQDVLPVWRPLYKGKLSFDLLAPKALSINCSHYDSAILVHNTNFLAISAPLHVSNDTSIAVVDHFLKPDPSVQHPHNDQPILVTRGELPEVLIPSDDHDVPLVALQGLVHRKVTLRSSSASSSTSACSATGTTSSFADILCRVKFQDLQQPAFPSTGNPSLR
mmetsp:Transcript_3004/g.7687  ORF Transcript_3004/g.7687 Transcript_3004/m.7687 type:complete len:266 (-) Transcript_3004:170-967(-)